MYYLAGYLSFIVMRENVEKWRIRSEERRVGKECM